VSTAIPLTIRPGLEPPNAVSLHEHCPAAIQQPFYCDPPRALETTRPHVPTCLATPVNDRGVAGLSDDSRSVLSAPGTDVRRRRNWGPWRRSVFTGTEDVFTRIAAMVNGSVGTEPSGPVTPALWAHR
jgi:hypothetical protein